MWSGAGTHWFNWKNITKPETGMIQIKEFVNSIFTSKTYILYRKGEKLVWLVDIGDVDPVVSFLKENEKTVKGVFLTHSHFDHIYGLSALVDYYPECKVYATEYTKLALASEKLNMSRYHECPIRYERNNVEVVHDGEMMKLYDGESDIHFYETPGHNPGCLTLIIGDYVFTGDAYIPGVKVVTNLPKGDKVLAELSLERIIRLAAGRTILPGHQVLE